MLGAVAVAATAPEPDDLAVAVDRDAHVARLALDDGRPPDLASARRQADEKRCRQNTGIGGPPGLDVESGDATGVARSCGTDRDRAHVVPLCPVFPLLGRGYAVSAMPGWCVRNWPRWTHCPPTLFFPHEATLVVRPRRSLSGGAALDRPDTGSGGPAEKGACGPAGRAKRAAA